MTLTRSDRQNLLGKITTFVAREILRSGIWRKRLETDRVEAHGLNRPG